MKRARKRLVAKAAEIAGDSVTAVVEAAVAEVTEAVEEAVGAAAEIVVVEIAVEAIAADGANRPDVTRAIVAKFKGASL